MNAELGKMQFLASPHVAELCLLVASIKTGLWALLAVKLKAAAQSGLSRVCVWPRQHQDRERAFLREILGSRQKSVGEQDLRAPVWLCSRPLGCPLVGDGPGN